MLIGRSYGRFSYSTCDLLDLRLAIDREQPHAERVGAPDVAFLLDRVAEGNALRRGAGREHHLDLGDRGGVEAGAKRSEQRQQLGCWIGLDGVEYAAVRQRLGKGPVVLAHDVEIDDEARTIVEPLVATAAQEVVDTLAHWRRSFLSTDSRAADRASGQPASRTRTWRRPCDGGTGASARGSSPEMLPWIGAGTPVPHGRQDGQASSVLTFGGPARPKKPAPSLL